MNHAVKHADVHTSALIYCRVSDKKQKTQGHGLESQEHRCRQFAEERGYDVEMVFPDDITGGVDFMKRPGMRAMLAYLDAQKGKPYVVIFDDLKRFARHTEFHLKLRREFAQRGARVECPNFEFEDTPEGVFIETVIAAQGQLEREQNRRQVIQKMTARVEKGYYVFNAPVGYRSSVIARTASCWCATSLWPRSLKKPSKAMPRGAFARKLKFCGSSNPSQISRRATGSGMCALLRSGKSLSARLTPGLWRLPIGVCVCAKSITSR
jgi:DNA invertase Pin-like site-specific DNA recombinase